MACDRDCGCNSSTSHRRNSERNYPPGRCAQVALAANGLPGVPGEHAECRPRPARRPAPRPARRSPTRAEQPATQPTSRDCCVGVQQADKRGRVPCMPHADERGVISATQSAHVLHHCSAQLNAQAHMRTYTSLSLRACNSSGGDATDHYYGYIDNQKTCHTQSNNAGCSCGMV